jgi:hypothetical protein
VEEACQENLPVDAVETQPEVMDLERGKLNRIEIRIRRNSIVHYTKNNPPFCGCERIYLRKRMVREENPNVGGEKMNYSKH